MTFFNYFFNFTFRASQPWTDKWPVASAMHLPMAAISKGSKCIQYNPSTTILYSWKSESSGFRKCNIKHFNRYTCLKSNSDLETQYTRPVTTVNGVCQAATHMAMNDPLDSTSEKPYNAKAV